MENKFEPVMSNRTDAELIKIVTVDKESYQSQALDAAHLEMEKRNLKISQYDEFIEQEVNHKNRKQLVDSLVVGSGKRIVHLLTDTVAWFILAMVCTLFGRFVFGTGNAEVMTALSYLNIVGSILTYYIFMELKYQKTFGKFITKTKVVRTDGGKPELGDIIARSFCRLIPFDASSFLFVKNGFHDYLSNTKVVKISEPK